jgi:hypothetical protein
MAEHAAPRPQRAKTVDLRTPPRDGEIDPGHLEAMLTLSMAERLERAFAWNRFASGLSGAALCARR